MMFDPKIFTEKEILEILAAAKQAFKDGERVVQWNAEGNSATMQFPGSPWEIIQECTATLKALNPRVYGYKVKWASYQRQY